MINVFVITGETSERKEDRRYQWCRRRARDQRFIARTSPTIRRAQGDLSIQPIKIRLSEFDVSLELFIILGTYESSESNRLHSLHTTKHSE